MGNKVKPVTRSKKRSYKSNAQHMNDMKRRKKIENIDTKANSNALCFVSADFDDDDGGEDANTTNINENAKIGNGEIKPLVTSNVSEFESNDYFDDSIDISDFPIKQEPPDESFNNTNLACTSTYLPEQIIDANMLDGLKKEDKGDESSKSDISSDLDSVYDSPTEAKLRRALRRKIRLQQKHVLRIKSLTRRNVTLMKQLASLKEIIATLKKEKQTT
ncbi:uncharacterized protein LOC119829660 [Zerene cesonia]|uniref:uncharacterized protein LOC119829660 n=1 Tax=Zerene cesonia TaxID=33412 RepID=UPI0018E54DD3|nr:uncharacterized protein LOC119829660 [Zerene cesonia]